MLTERTVTPARAFASFMKFAVANRPITKFEIDVPLPDWQLEPDEEAWGAPPEEGIGPALVDENGNPIGTPAGESQGIPVPAQPGGPDQTELDRIFNSPAPPREQRPPPPPRSEPAPDPLQPRPDQPQG